MAKNLSPILVNFKFVKIIRLARIILTDLYSKFNRLIYFIVYFHEPKL